LAYHFDTGKDADRYFTTLNDSVEHQRDVFLTRTERSEVESPILCTIGDISLLATCRPINDEGNRVLYSRNVFLAITHEFDKFISINGMCRWMQDIGRNQVLLRKIQIDLSPISSYVARQADRSSTIDIRRFMDQIWLQAGDHLEISFVIGRPFGEAPEYSNIDVVRMNKLVAALTPASTLGLWAYFRSVQTLVSVKKVSQWLWSVL
jgi:hypothetical protein